MESWIASHAIAIKHGAIVLSSVMVALLPTVITGLSNYPYTQSVLQKLLDFLSLAVPKNVQGTFKMPFTRSPPPGSICMDDVPKPPPSTGGAGILVGIFVLAQIASCATGQGEHVKDVIDCATEAVQAQQRSIIPTVREILQDATNWREALAGLAASAGSDLVTCAVNAVLSDYRTHPSVSPELLPKIKRAQERGDDYLAHQKPIKS